MNFYQVIEDVCWRMDKAGVRYALIGGFAMAMRGVQRATVDMGFLLMLEDLEPADKILRGQGYERVFHSDNVSHYRSRRGDFGRLDILHAFRPPSLDMLERADRLEVMSGVTLPVVQTEDLIGLKIQAACNDPQRAEQDWLDIKLLLQTAAHTGVALNWPLIGEYLNIFECANRLGEMRSWHGCDE